MMRKIQLAPTATLFHADCRDALRAMADCSVDAVVTDPPYELNFMGKGWDNTGIANDPALWAEVFRVLKPGGHVAAFSASRTYHRMACAIEDAGFEIRDSLMWVYGTGFPKSQDVSKFIDKMAGAEREVIGQDRNFGKSKAADGKNAFGDYAGTWDITAPATPAAQEWEGWGTALKPAFEPIVLARKPLSEGTVAANVLRWRTGALNIDGCRVATTDHLGGGGYNTAGTSQKNLANATSFATKVMDREFVQPEGRWPANVVHDGSDEVVGAFPSARSSGVFNAKDSGNKGERVTNFGGSGTPASMYADSGSAARFFYSAKASKQDRNGSKHPTVKPIALMEWLCTLITPPGGTILDPFGGSGTTAIAASNKGFPVILCEREAEYIADIRARFGPALPTSAALPRSPHCHFRTLYGQRYHGSRCDPTEP